MTATAKSSLPETAAIKSPRLTRRARTLLGHGALHVLLIIWGITFLIPLLWVLTTSLKTPGQVFIVPVQWIPKTPRWSNYREIFEILPLTSFIRNSLFVTAMGTLGSVFSSLLVGYSLARLRWPGRDAVFTLLVATMMLPGIVTLIPTFILFKYLGWLDTFLPLFVPSWFGVPFYIFLMRQFMIGLPYELEEAARIDGASSLRILAQIIVPLSGPAIAAVAIFATLAHYNDFMGPLIYLSTNDKFTLALGLFWYQGRYGNFWHLVMAASTVAITPVLILFFIAQRHFVRGIALTGLAGR
ncbi:MAG: L-arabinose transport system permease protein AraQ [Chloroflexi bacterium ADurb.Bin325]|nr:MAG: L-arabinose transport system permease protein AraQ [Chloroflexi bacterium ADurb.Bin325]